MRKFTKKDLKDAQTPHKIWHKFSNWLAKTYGKDLWGKVEYLKIKDAKGKIKKIKYRNFDDYKLSQRLVGYEVMCKIKKFVNRSCPEIKICNCDDSLYSGSDILLIPHPKHGISIMFIPQCTSIQNHIFLYEGHYNNLMKELKKMKSVYKKSF